MSSIIVNNHLYYLIHAILPTCKDQGMISSHTYLYECLHTLKTIIKCCRGSLTLRVLCRSWGPSGPHSPAPRPPPLRPALIWHSTPTPVCGPDCMTAMMTQSFLWAAGFSKVTALPPHRGQIWGRCWVGLQRDTHLSCWKGDMLPGPQPLRLLSEEDTCKRYYSFLYSFNLFRYR